MQASPLLGFLFFSVFSLFVQADIDMPPLRSFADPINFLIGSQVDYERLTDSGSVSDPNYRGYVAYHYNFVTSSTYYWAESEPEPNQFNLLPGDVVFTWAQAQNQSVRCHNLVWDQILPYYVNSSVDSATLREMLYNHIDTILNHTGSQCYAWDVVNEPFNGDGTLKQDIWYNALGPNYIAEIFTHVRTLAPNVKLFLNDDNVAEVNAKSTGLFNLVQQLKNHSVPIDGIGMECHFRAQYPPSIQSVEENIVRFITAFPDIEIHITEMDINLNNTLGSIADKWNLQAEIYNNMLGLCLKYKTNCKAFETWGFTDRYSWIGQLEFNPISNFGGYMFAPLPFDVQYLPKPAFYSLVDAFTTPFNLTYPSASPTPSMAADSQSSSGSGFGIPAVLMLWCLFLL